MYYALTEWSGYDSPVLSALRTLDTCSPRILLLAFDQGDVLLRNPECSFIADPRLVVGHDAEQKLNRHQMVPDDLLSARRRSLHRHAYVVAIYL